MPSIPIAHLYEAIYIVDPDLGEEQVNAIAGKYKSLVETQGGTVEKIDVWERRKLAYEIKGRTEGIYVVMQFTCFPVVEAELRRIFLISEDQIRYMILRPDEIEPEAATATPPHMQRTARPVAVVPTTAPAQSEPEAAPVETVAETTEAAPEPTAVAEAPEAQPEEAAIAA